MNDVILNKKESIERCIYRVRTTYQAKMIGFRNLAVHQYQKLDIGILVSIIEHHLDDFFALTTALLTVA